MAVSREEKWYPTILRVISLWDAHAFKKEKTKIKPHTRYLLTLLPYVIIVLEKSNTLFKPYFFADFGNNVSFYNFSVKDWDLMFPKMDQTLKLETLQIWSNTLAI